MSQSGKISYLLFKFLFISKIIQMELIIAGLFLQSDPEIVLFKNVYRGSTTMDIGRRRIGLREKLYFKTGLMKPWWTWYRILERILAVRAIPHEAKMSQNLYPCLAQPQDRDCGGRTRGTDSWHLSWPLSQHLGSKSILERQSG